MDARRVELLQRMPVFGALDERALHLLVECARVREVAAGAWFFREGDEARSMFVLERGHAVVTRQWQGREIELNRFGPGDCFGEMALMDLHPRSAGVRALDDCAAIEFGPDEMMRLHEADLQQFALLQMNLGRELSRRLRATDELLFRAAMGELPPAPKALG
jgi:CRP-like cAMP-binding protein